jgi:hypothetical protein
MIGYGITEITRREPDLRAQLPHFTPLIAALLCAGFRLLPPPHENHQDVLVGCEHLQDFKRARANNLDRVITFRFLTTRREVLGRIHAVQSFAERYEGDSIWASQVRAHPHFEKWHDALRSKLLAAVPAVMAIQGERHAVIPVGPRSSAEKRAAFAHMFEEGW